MQKQDHSAIGGGPAFPVAQLDATGLPYGPRGAPAAPGMTLRDYFAAHLFAEARKVWEGGHPDGYEGIARHAYLIADAMLKARQA